MADEKLSRFGWPIKIAVAWSALVTVGCYAAVSCFEYPSIETTAEFVVLVRNVAIMGAAAIALPVSLYTLWMKDTGFRADLKKTITEELDRQKREQEERRKLEMQERAQREKEFIRQIVEFVSKNPGCTFPEIRSTFPNHDKQHLEFVILKAHDQKLIDAPNRKITGFEGNAVQFGNISLAPKGRDLLQGTALD